MAKYIVSALVHNNAGVLARVSSLFGRRGYNIDSLTVSATNDAHISRITMTVMGDEYILEQIIKQFSKLEETIKVVHILECDAHCLELVLIKIKADAMTRDSVREVCELYGATVVETTEKTIIVRLTDSPSTIDTFINIIGNFEIVEMCRTGLTALTKGDSKI